MKKINILESLLELDKKSSNRYELATLYEACKLKDDEKVQLVKYIDSYEHPSLIGQFLESKCEGMCDTNVDDDDCTDIECLKKTVDDINDNEVPVIFAFDDFEEIEEKALNENIEDENSAQHMIDAITLLVNGNERFESDLRTFMSMCGATHIEELSYDELKIFYDGAKRILSRIRPSGKELAESDRNLSKNDIIYRYNFGLPLPQDALDKIGTQEQLQHNKQLVSEIISKIKEIIPGCDVIKRRDWTSLTLQLRTHQEYITEEQKAACIEMLEEYPYSFETYLTGDVHRKDNGIISLNPITRELKESLNEEIVIDDSRAAQKYVWNKVKDIDAITDDDSLYWRFDDSLRQGDAAKIITDESDLPDNAVYKFSLVEVDINLYYNWEDECWYVLDKTYQLPVVEEAVEIHECPVCKRNFAEHEMSNETCPKCGEQLHKTDSGEYEKTDNDIDESKCIKEDVDSWKIEYNDGAVQRCQKPNEIRNVEGTWEDVVEELDLMMVDLPHEYDENDDELPLSLEKFVNKYEDNADFSGSTVILKIFKNDKLVYEISDYEDWDDILDESKSIREDLQKDLRRRYTISNAHTDNSVIRNIEELAASELVKEIKPITKHDTQMFEMISSDGRAFYLIPVTTSQFDVYDANEELVTRSEFSKYIVDEVLSDKSNLEFVYQVVGGGFSGIYSREEIEALPCFSGKYTDDQSEIRANGGFTSRKELDNQPVLDGYVGPMMNGWRNHKMVLRYETQEIYDRLSESLFEVEQGWTDYCPHCTNRTLVMVNDNIAVCDDCAAEYKIIPMANGKARLINIEDLEEGFLDDVKKVGKTVGQIAKERWDDSYTKAIATGIKKNFDKTKLGKDLKRVGDSIKDTDTYKKVATKVNDVKQTIKDNKHDDKRKPEDISVNVRGKDYRVSDLKYKLNGKAISADEVAKMSAFERRKVQIIVPRTAKPLPKQQNEGLFEQFPHTQMLIDLSAVALDVWNELQPEKLGEDKWVEFDFREPHIVNGKQVLSFDAIGPEKHIWGKLIDEQNTIRVVIRGSDEEAVCEDVDDIVEFILDQHGANEVVEGYFSDDDFEDDIEHANLYGGDTMYCRDCGTKKKYDEDGFTYCPECASIEVND